MHHAGNLVFGLNDPQVFRIGAESVQDVLLVLSSPDVCAAVHLPGHEGFTLERGEGTETSDEAEPADFHQGDAVEQDAVGQDEGDIGPAHTGPHGQDSIHHVHQGPVL